MMMGGMFWDLLLMSMFLIGFAYIIWAVAGREKNGLKTVGQGIALVMVMLAVIMFIYGGIYGGVMGRGCFGRGLVLWGPDSARHMMQLPENERYEYMESIMKSPQIRQWLKEYFKECETKGECEIR